MIQKKHDTQNTKHNNILHIQPNQARPPRKCPNCGKITQSKQYPFCSARCANSDLNQWLTGGYVIEGEEENENEPQK